MKTLTVTKARQNLGGWLKRAVAGEEIGVVFGDQVVALRPVPIMAADYMETEYGLTKEEADRAAKRIREESRAAYERGDYVTLDDLKRRLAARRKAKRRGHDRRAA
jgi:antitoxin (DNA-binding transcriptional repressor) of toxin-antitoxin stability system